MPSVILARLDLHRKAFPAGLKDEVQLSIFLFVEVPQLEAVGGEDLGKGIFKEASLMKKTAGFFRRSLLL